MRQGSLVVAGTIACETCRTLGGVGDVDGDGIEDIVLKAFADEDPVPVAYLFSGPIEGSLTEEAAVARFVVPPRLYIGAVNLAARDLNDDGRADVFITIAFASACKRCISTRPAGWAYLFMGG